MMKRTLSLLLVLVMVLGLVPFQVSAAENSNEIYIDESTSIEEFVEQTIIVQPEDSGEESVTLPSVPTVPQVPVAGQESEKTLSSAGIACDCGMGEVGLYSHSDGCILKQYYIQSCSGAAAEIYTRWLNASAANREFLEDYLAANYPETLTQLQALRAAEAEPEVIPIEESELNEFASERLSGEASAAVDGITVDALGVPEGSELTVQEPTDKALDAVEALASQEATGEQLFVYDISVQNEESDNWQPEGSVKLTLTLPGAENLPKYTPVKIVHVDDEGNTSTMDAYVDEGGKVVFETNGFSTFAGFTVDFDYDGVQFSIPGETSVKLSELFENLKMPLNAADVANVEYTDYTQIKVEKLESDWLLTSLKAFTTEEKLALTMADGTVYHIKVTDAVYANAYFAYRHEKGVSESSNNDGNGLTECAWLDSQSASTKGNGYVRVLLDPGSSDGCPGTGTTGSYTNSENGTYDGEPGEYENWYWYSQPLIIDGRNQNGTMTISLRRNNKSETANKTYYLDIWHWKIINGAQVTINVGGPNTSDGDGFLAGDKIVIRQYFERYNGSGTVEYEQKNMFEVADGSLTITGTSDVQVYLDGNGKLTDDNNKQVVRLLEGADNFTMNYTTVRNAPAGGVISWATDLKKFSMTSTTFESTVKRNSANANGNGGAIYLTGQGTSNGFRTVTEFSLNKCTFNGNKAGSQGGAICLMDAVRLVNIKDCTFENCETGANGGAIAFRGSFGKINITGSDPDGTDTTKLTTFSNCTSKGNGGAICVDTVALRYNSTSANTHYSRTHTLNLNGCRFTSCVADATHSSTSDGLGGAINLAAQINKVSVNYCTFDKCQAKGGDTNLAGAGICFGQANVNTTEIKTGETAKVYGGSPGLSGWTPASVTTWTESDSTKGSDIRSVTLGWEGTSDGKKVTIQRTTIGDVTINNSTFKNSSNTHQGGAFLVRTGASMESLTVTNTVVENCKITDKGSAVFFNNCIVGTSSFTNCTFRNNEVLQSLYTGGGTIRTTGQTSTVMTIDNCKFMDNKGNLAGGGVYWNAGATKTTPSQYAAGTTPAETKITIKNSEFRRNTAEINEDYPDWDRPEGTETDILYVDANGNPLRKVRFGGGIFCETKMSIESCIFDGNKADQGGGLCMGVYNANYRMFADNEITQLKLDSGTQFFNNQAQDGGGLAIRANKTLAINDGDNIRHTVDFTLGGAQIYNNVATRNGGGIYYIAETYENDELGNAEVNNYTKTITIDEGTIYGNSAGQHGGGIYMESNSKTTITVTDGTVEGDDTETGDDTEAGNSTIYSNYAGLTRAVTFKKTGTDSNGNNIGTTTISAGTVTGGNGGGIYLTSNDAKVSIYGGYVGAYLDDNDDPVAAGNQAYRINSDSNTGNGGGIFVRGSTVVSMSGGYIVNNTSGTSGGGIAIHGGSTMQLKNGFVENNVSNMGGGISLNGATGDGGNNVETKYGMYVNGGTVKNNQVHPITGESRAYGGGICIASSSTMLINNGNIIGNKAISTDGVTYAASQEGGGIAVCESSTLTITGGYIKENHAYDGGGITVRNMSTVSMTGEITLKDGKVTSYKGAIEKNSAQRRGGGIYMPTDGNSSMTMTGGYIYSNECKQTDGAVGSECLGGGIMIRSTNTFTLDGGRIDGNTAFAGGGIYAYNAEKVLIKNGVLSGNIVPRHGGAIYNDYSNVEVTGGEFYGNKATKTAYSGYGGSQGNGGAIFNYGSEDYPFTFKVTGTGGNFHDNEAKNSGGAVYNGGVGTVTISGGTFTSNTAVTNGGAISNNNCAISITTGTFKQNTAKDGGAIYATGGTVSVTGGTFNTNISTQYGGGAYFNATTVTNFTTGVFDANVAKNGAGLCITDSTVSFTGGTFKNGIADRGGALFIRSATVTIDTITIQDNHAKADSRYGDDEFLRGGGICVDTYGSGPATVTINGGTFTGNTAAYGGALWINNNAKTENKANIATITINGGDFTQNTASAVDGYTDSGNGGGIWIGGGDYSVAPTDEDPNGVYTSLTLNGGKIGELLTDGTGGNTATGNGGGVFAQGKAQVVIQSKTVDGKTTYGNVTNNQAHNGGGFYITTGANLTVSDGDITSNRAVAVDGADGLNGVGGGICVAASGSSLSNVTVNGGNIKSNSADSDGGGVWISGGEIKVNDKVTSLTMQGGSIKNNTAGGNGGGIWSGELAEVSVLATESTHGEIDHNTAKNGGGVYVTTGAQLTVDNGYITGNQAVQPQNASGLTSARGEDANLYGVGGGICVTAGLDGAPSTFILTGDNVAIYDNTATFAADDVFASGNKTKLSIPTVANMNLAGYGFKPEGWFEDYNTGDERYRMGLDMITANGGTLELGTDEMFTNVYRYRNASATHRKLMHITPAYVSDTGVNKASAYVAMTLGIPAAADDIVVIDYGSKVTINAWENDLFMNVSDFANTKDDKENVVHHSYLYNVTELPNTVQEKDGVYYNIEKPATTNTNHFYQTWFTGSTNGRVDNLKNGIITFEPKKITMDKEASFYYMVEHNGVWYYANVTIVPATTIYFEDNMSQVKYHTSESYEDVNGNWVSAALAQWKTAGTAVNSEQDQDRPGTAMLESLDADNIYGYDSSHTSTSTYSNGSVKWVTVTRDPDTLATTNARATFTFTGTGFDIISLCKKNTGIVMVSVYEGEVVDFDKPPYDRYITSYMVDTHYGYVYNDKTGKWEIDPNNDTTLYQVPVIKADLTKVVVVQDDHNTPDVDETEYWNYGYGTYSVELYVAPSFLDREPGYWSAEFYLDAIRIYNPAGFDGSYSYVYDAVKRDKDGNPVYDEDGMPVYEEVTVTNTGTVIQNAYNTDGEAWPEYTELRNMFINQSELKVEGTTGIIFIDGTAEASVEDYKSWGPNNEVYLNPDESVAFKLDASTYAQNVASVQLGLKGLTGLGKVKVQAKGKNETEATVIFEKEISTTDLYYDISCKTGTGSLGIANKVVTITNTGETPISITNVKVTHKGIPQSGYSFRNWAMVDGDTVGEALAILNAEELVNPIVTPKRPALSFNGMVCYNVFFSAEELGDLTGADLGLAVFSTGDPEGTVETAREVIYGAEEIDGLYMTSTSGVNAKYLGDTQYFRVFAKKADGTFVYSKMVSYSAVNYAMNVLLKSEDVALKQLVVAMLNYGAAAQQFFGYKTDDLMNECLTADDQALLANFDANSLKGASKVDASKVGSFASTGGFTKKTPAISFKGAFEINYFFTPAYAADNGMTLYFWSEDTYNSVTELTAENADKAVNMTLEDGVYTAASDEIAAKYLDKTVFVAAVYESNGTTYCSGVLPYSIAAYCQKSPAGVQELATAAAIYGCTAKQYFGV